MCYNPRDKNKGEKQMTHDEVFGRAEWITPRQSCAQPYLRTDFITNGRAANAGINICGLGFFELYINGKKVSDDLLVPSWTSYCRTAFFYSAAHKEYDDSIHRVCVLHYELTDLLTDGENKVAIRLGGGWFRRFHYGETMLCYRLVFTDDDGYHELLSRPERKGPKWKPSPITRSHMMTGESHDYRLETPNWTTADYASKSLYGQQDWFDCDRSEGPKADIVWQEAPADKVERFLIPKLLERKADYSVYDLGENCTTQVYVQYDIPAGEVVTLKFAEQLTTDGDPHPDRYASNHFDQYISDGQPRVSHPAFTWQAGRYFSCTNNAAPLQAAVIHADVPVTATFESGNENLNWLYDAYVRTQLANMHCGVTSDCPQREGLGYTGDGQLAAEAAMLTLGGESFYRKWMRDIADGQESSGRIHYTAPFVPAGGGPGGWGCAIVHVPYVFYKVYGDKQPLETYYPNMLQLFRYFDIHSDGDLLTSEEPFCWCLGEWCTPDAANIQIAPPFVNTYFFIKSLLEAREIAQVIDRTADIPRFDSMIANKKAALIKNYYDESSGDFDHNWDGANAFALDIGLGDERTVAKTVAHYKALEQYDTGIFGTDILTRYLFRNGYPQLAFDLLAGNGEASFGNMRNLGANTLLEHWDGRSSWSHPMFGSVVSYLFTELLGIHQREGSTGYTDVCVNPAPIKHLGYAKGSITGKAGKITVSVVYAADGTPTATIEADAGVKVAQ
jgi:alpha-L-rhamnosidase